jgi:uridine kinase
MAFEPSAENISEIIREKQKEMNRNIIVAVGGPGGSGKSTFARLIEEQLPDSAVIHTDDYRLPRKERRKNLLGSNPAANKVNLLLTHLDLIKNNTPFDKPVYDTISGNAGSTESYIPGAVNLIEGEITTVDKLFSKYDLTIYLDTSILIQLSYRLNRDRVERRYSLMKSIYVFLRSNLIDYKIYNHKIKERVDLTVKRIK